MADFDLEKRLKSAPVPEREEDYWESFPRRISARLGEPPAGRPAGERYWWPRLVWGGGIAFACLMIGFAIGHWRGRAEKGGPDVLLQDGKMLHEVLTLFPNRVRAIVQDEHGVQLVLADGADVPASTPIYVHICDGKQCTSLVTFSGQEIKVAGQKVTVLSDAQGGVIVTGNRFVWSSDQPSSASRGLTIEAKTLNSLNL